MAAYGQDMGGNQIFVSIRRGKEYPPQVVDIRYVYECGFMLCWRMRRSCVSMYVWVKSVCYGGKRNRHWNGERSNCCGDRRYVTRLWYWCM